MPNAVRHLAIISPAWSAVMSNAMPILTASVANCFKSSRAMPACPPAATIWAIPSADIGNSCVICRISAPICLNCSGVSKSTVFLTSAMADSYLMASLAAMPRGAAIAAAATAPALRLLTAWDKFADAFCFALIRFIVPSYCLASSFFLT